MPDTPEQKARQDIDAKLTASGWLVQDRYDLDLSAGRGIAVREFPMKSGFGFTDYLLYLERNTLGAVKRMPAAVALPQAKCYPRELLPHLRCYRRPCV